ncbi:uncharacterized protein LOC125239640 [Leguminivora glycinivorella]|uniref:uncharacterized protein LOC125239640 n=1 Tax=Leguminivora glycinivorella TaxID=1035111 RepID=UPI00200CA3A5|nr:uncharacterized protein LOC125239640 [Leguminivora glycinivorella]
MSLIHSLLVGIALVAVVRGNMSSCIMKDLGHHGPFLIDYADRLPSGTTTNVKIPTNICSPPMKTVGVIINVCNNNFNNTHSAMIDGPSEDTFSPVDITCRDPTGCSLFVNIFCGK